MRNFVALAGLALAAGSVLPSFAQKARLPYLDETWIVPYITGGTEYTLSYRTQHFYNAKNQLVRDAKYGFKLNGQTSFLVEYTCYDYDDSGRLAVTYTRKASYDDESGKTTMAQPVDSVVYTYNEQGQLVQKTAKRNYYTYSYDADGNLSEEKMFVTATGLCQTVKTYSGYVAPECPALVVTTSDLYDYYNCKEAYTYNSFNKPVTYEKYTETAGEDASEVVKNVTEKYHWVYDDAGTLKGKAHYAAFFSGMPVTAQDSLGYTVMEDNKDCEVSKNYRYDSEQGAWIENVTAQMGYTYYNDYAGSLAVNVDVNPVEGTVNDYAISFKLPEFALIGSYAFNIYRDGQLIKEDHLSDMSLIDPKTMTFTYVDKQVTSGLHDYFVQTAYLSELLEQTPKNVSNVVEVNKVIDLPAVQNLRLADYRRDRDKGYVIKLVWDAPEHAEDYELQRYNVYEDSWSKVAVNKDEDGQAQEWEQAMATNTTKRTMRVECVYPYGCSEAVSIDLFMKDIIEGISQVVASDVKTTYANHVLQLSQPSNVKVYNVAGQLVKAANGVSEVSFETESAGSYVVLVEKDGKVSALKVQK